MNSNSNGNIIYNQNSIKEETKLNNNSANFIDSLSEQEKTVLSNEVKKFFEEENNYIDYFIIIGVKPELFKESFLYTSSINEINKKIFPEIISKFPKSDKKTIVINNKIIKKIYPHGFEIIESMNIPEDEFFTIILDNQLYKYFSHLLFLHHRYLRN